MPTPEERENMQAPEEAVQPDSQVDDVKEKLDKAQAELAEKQEQPEPDKKIGIMDGGKGKDAPGKNEYPPVNIQMPKRFKPQFKPEITVKELAGFLETIMIIQGEDMVRKLSLYPNIEFKEIPMPPMPQMMQKK